MDDCTYTGFEQGPIRPPSEANSLILPVTDGCSWNQCTFCEMYTAPQKKFKARSEEEVLEMIRIAGAEQTIISSDFGQADNGDPVSGFDCFFDELLENGITEEEINSPHAFGLLGIRERLYPLGGQVFFKGRPGSRCEIAAHFIGDNMRQGGLSQSRWPIEKHMVQGFLAMFRGCDQDLQVFPDDILPHHKFKANKNIGA